MIGDAVAWIFAIALTIPTATFAIELVLGLRSPRRPSLTRRAGRIAVVVPAHDEARGIERTLEDLRAAMPANGRLIVVADNCTDQTAQLARSAGYEVIERQDPSRPGKGHALAFARDHLNTDPPEVVVVIDADCRIKAPDLAALTNGAATNRRPVQATYLMTPRLDAGPMVQLSGFALLVRNKLRQRGLARLGAPALLAGTGMAFPWTIFATAPLATGETVEDLVLGVELTLAGTPPLYLPQARIWSDPAGEAGTREQRKRWEQGSLAAGWRLAPRLALRGSIWLALDLLIPPLALLILLDIAAVAMTTGWSTWGGAIEPALLIGTVTVTAMSLVLLGWALHGRAQMQPATLLRVPLYILWKLPIYVAALARRERRWTRTTRD
jgi:cellulose synthase/poly-beta-1,6-N-acetylglucosamine synthase-like glycosyltransferase